MSKSGGACFTPRIQPRPAYPSALTVARQTFRDYGRDVLHGAILLALLAPLYDAALAASRARGLSDRAFFAGFLSLSHSACYAGVCGFFYLVETRGWLSAAKIPRKRALTQNKAKLDRSCFLEAAIGQVVTGPLISYFIFDVFAYFGMPPLAADATATWRSADGLAALARAIVAGHLFNDVTFYWAHRASHTRLLYSKVHKQHHTYSATVAHAAEYAGPVETVLSRASSACGRG